MSNFHHDEDPTAKSRKRDHIELAFKSQVSQSEIDTRFFYEPILSGHPQAGSLPALPFLGKTFKAPIWVSSMTGGTDWANTINHNLARVCKDFGFGMGLGSCRSLLSSNETLPDFDVRHLIGDEQVLYANLGVAQLEQLIIHNKLQLAVELVDKLSADGLIVHVNPLQEWLQPEGDRYSMSPLDIIKRLLDETQLKLIVKEVGQGMGKESLRALFSLPIEAVDFAANGGTNFARLELLRQDEAYRELYDVLARVGHGPDDMVEITNQLILEMGNTMQCKQVIISGGVKNFLDGYYLTQKIQLPAVYGQASAFLKHARGDYESLHAFVEQQVKGLEVAQAFLKVRP